MLVRLPVVRCWGKCVFTSAAPSSSRDDQRPVEYKAGYALRWLRVSSSRRSRVPPEDARREGGLTKSIVVQTMVESRV